MVESGYEIPWENGPPPRCRLENQKDTKEYEEFVDGAVEKLVIQGAIEECTEEEIHCVLPLGAKKNAAKKLRLTLDARHVNRYERPRKKRKLEGLDDEGREMFEDMTCGATVDISCAYHHVNIHPRSQKYLGIKWRRKFYRWCVLPFGLGSAPGVFCRVVAEPVKVFRQRGIRMIAYMDDFPHGARDTERCLWSSAFIIFFLKKCGFIIEPEKKCLGYNAPLTVLPALGFDIDFGTQMYRVTAARKERALKKAQELLELRRDAWVLPKEVSSVASQIVSMTLALGSAARIMTRAMYACVGERVGRRAWKQKLQITEEAREEMEFWVRHFDEYNGQPIAREEWKSHVEFEGSNDAGEKGYGGFLKVRVGRGDKVVQRLIEETVERAKGAGMQAKVEPYLKDLIYRGIEFRGELTVEQQKESSTFREAVGVESLLKFAGPLLEGRAVELKVDNMCLAYGLGGKVRGLEHKVFGGSKKPKIQALVRRIFLLCLKWHMRLKVVWIPRELNERADYLSKMTEHYDFRLGEWSFRQLDHAWGPHTIDRFSSDRTVMVGSGRFNSRFLCLNSSRCEGIDAFAQDWRGENNWCHPPYKMVGRVVQHMRACKASGTVVLPFWERAAWWPLVRGEGGEGWGENIVESRSIGMSVGPGGDTKGALVPPQGEGYGDLPCGHLWAIRIEF